MLAFRQVRYLLTPRYFYSTKVSQSPLAQLRRRTGYSFAKCKEALTKFNNDVDQAERYVREQAQKEGWAKAERVKDRTAREGVIGVMIEVNKGVILEVNCETDFVSKNIEFRKFAADIVQATFASLPLVSMQHPHSKRLLTPADISSLGLVNNETVADLMAKNIGHFGENITASRGCILSADTNQSLGHFVYNAVPVNGTGVLLGTYASLALIDVANVGRASNVKDIGQKICQHIVGMNPKPLDGGIEGDKDSEFEQQEDFHDQAFLLEPTVTMGEWLRSRDVRVTDFVRYELGGTQ